MTVKRELYLRDYYFNRCVDRFKPKNKCDSDCCSRDLMILENRVEMYQKTQGIEQTNGDFIFRRTYLNEVCRYSNNLVPQMSIQHRHQHHHHNYRHQ